MIDNYYKKIKSSKDDKELEIEEEDQSDDYLDEDDVEEEYKRLILQ